MAADIWTVIGAVITVVSVNVGLFAWLRADIRELRADQGELRADFGQLRKETTDKFEEMRRETAAQFEEIRGQTAGQIKELRAQSADQFSDTSAQLGQLRERMAHLEGLLEGLREAVAGRRAA